MDEELRKAITRLRNVPPSDWQFLSCCSLQAVAEAYLAEHPPDDDERATEAWLLQIGGKVSDDGVVTISADPENGNTVFRSLDFWQGRLCEWWYCAYQRLGQDCARVAMPEQKTRGDVRRLCQALGVPIDEPS